MTKTFDTSTVKGMKAAERFKNSLNNKFESVNVYAIGLSRVQIVGLKPITEFDRINHGPFEHPVSEPVNDQTFINNLEARHMSSWTEPEMARYNRLTGQGVAHSSGIPE